MKHLLYIIALSWVAFIPNVYSQNIEVSNMKAHVQPDIDLATLKEKLNENTQEHFMECHALNRTVNADISSGYFQNGSYYWKVAGHDLAFRVFLKIEDLPRYDTLFVLNKDGERLQFLTVSDLLQEKWTSTIVNDELTLQYKPFNSTTTPKVKVRSYSMEVAKRTANTDDFGDSQPCEVNVNCPEGNNHQDVKNSIVRIDVKIGNAYFWCTGSLVNTTDYSYKPYILTAEHCALNGSTFASTQDFSDWVFYFQYEAPTCTNPSSEGSLANKQITGATLLARSNDNGGDNGSDFLLLELSTGIPSTFNPFFAGWSRLNNAPTSGVAIHHPNGDIKKISTSTTTAVSGNYPGATVINSHWEIRWAATVTNHGVTEGGSSGGPFFNENKLISGTLTGGYPNCSQNTSQDFYGKFSYHWDQNGSTPNRRLKDWLDPGNIGVSVLSGATLGDSAPPYEASNIILKPNPVTEGKLYLQGLPVVGNRIIQIFNLQGEMVYPGKETVPYTNIEQDGYIPVSHLPNGPYVLRILNNGQAQSFKFIINN
ncbi:trypsin-like serine protease [Owenweeksia hongkongensis]|uniref:trypsin-like serine protease n=1 Tax=Owenweeksia hongkongensis TaxID=253245 RepID=UPI003A9227AD